MARPLLICSLVLVAAFTAKPQKSALDSVLALIGGERDAARKAMLYNAAARFTDDHTQALQFADSALRYSEDSQNKSQLAQAYYRRGSAFFGKADYSASLTSFLKAAALFEAAKSLKDLSAVYNSIGSVQMRQRNNTKALEYFIKSVELKVQINDSSALSIPLNNIGSVYDELGQYDKALEYYSRALQLCEKLNDKTGIASANQNVAIAYSNVGQFEKAEKHFFEALKIEESLNNTAGISMSLNNIGSLYNLTERAVAAIPLLQRAVSLARENKLQLQEMDALQTLSEAYELTGNKGEALTAMKQHIALKEKIFTAENARQLNELQVKYETAVKENKMRLMQKDFEVERLHFRDQRLWLLVFIFGLLATVALVGLFLYRTRAAKRMDALKHQQKEAEDKHRITELQLSALRAQMNPHFIFNCMNSFHHLLRDNQREKAELYLDKFAQLLRVVLESSHAVTITLADEIKMLRLYLDLEALRFRNNFTYMIETNLESDPENIEISSMLLQPYVENAVKHAFTGLSRAGHLKLAFTQENDMLQIEINDNGIGRKKAMELKTGSHKFASLGMKVTRDRIDLLNTGLSTEATVVISDLENENQEAAGTRVKLTLPIE